MGIDDLDMIYLIFQRRQCLTRRWLEASNIIDALEWLQKQRFKTRTGEAILLTESDIKVYLHFVIGGSV